MVAFTESDVEEEGVMQDGSGRRDEAKFKVTGC